MEKVAEGLQKAIKLTGDLNKLRQNEELQAAAREILGDSTVESAQKEIAEKIKSIKNIKKHVDAKMSDQDSSTINHVTSSANWVADKVRGGTASGFEKFEKFSSTATRSQRVDELSDMGFEKLTTVTKLKDTLVEKAKIQSSNLNVEALRAQGVQDTLRVRGSALAEKVNQHGASIAGKLKDQDAFKEASSAIAQRVSDRNPGVALSFLPKFESTSESNMKKHSLSPRLSPDSVSQKGAVLVEKIKNTGAFASSESPSSVIGKIKETGANAISSSKLAEKVMENKKMLSAAANTDGGGPLATLQLVHSTIKESGSIITTETLKDQFTKLSNGSEGDSVITKIKEGGSKINTDTIKDQFNKFSSNENGPRSLVEKLKETDAIKTQISKLTTNSDEPNPFMDKLKESRSKINTNTIKDQFNKISSNDDGSKSLVEKLKESSATTTATTSESIKKQFAKLATGNEADQPNTLIDRIKETRTNLTTDAIKNQFSKLNKEEISNPIMTKIMENTPKLTTDAIKEQINKLSSNDGESGGKSLVDKLTSENMKEQVVDKLKASGTKLNANTIKEHITKLSNSDSEGGSKSRFVDKLKENGAKALATENVKEQLAKVSGTKLTTDTIKDQFMKLTVSEPKEQPTPLVEEPIIITTEPPDGEKTTETQQQSGSPLEGLVVPDDGQLVAKKRPSFLQQRRPSQIEIDTDLDRTVSSCATNDDELQTETVTLYKGTSDSSEEDGFLLSPHGLDSNLSPSQGGGSFSPLIIAARSLLVDSSESECLEVTVKNISAPPKIELPDTSNQLLKVREKANRISEDSRQDSSDTFLSSPMLDSPAAPRRSPSPSFVGKNGRNSVQPDSEEVPHQMEVDIGFEKVSPALIQLDVTRVDSEESENSEQRSKDGDKSPGLLSPQTARRRKCESESSHKSDELDLWSGRLSSMSSACSPLRGASSFENYDAASADNLNHQLSTGILAQTPSGGLFTENNEEYPTAVSLELDIAQVTSPRNEFCFLDLDPNPNYVQPAFNEEIESVNNSTKKSHFIEDDDIKRTIDSWNDSQLREIAVLTRDVRLMKQKMRKRNERLLALLKKAG